MKRNFLLLALCVMWLGCRAAVGVGSLTVEGLKAPLNVENDAPRLSWIITATDEHDVMQKAYQILVATSPELLKEGKADVWDSGKVPSGASVLVPYAGPALEDNARVWWTVRCHTTRGVTPWATPAEWGMGQRGEGHWRGNWIGYEGPFEWDIESDHSRLSSRYLRKEFKTGGRSDEQHLNSFHFQDQPWRHPLNGQCHQLRNARRYPRTL